LKNLSIYMNKNKSKHAMFEITCCFNGFLEIIKLLSSSFLNLVVWSLKVPCPELALKWVCLNRSCFSSRRYNLCSCDKFLIIYLYVVSRYNLKTRWIGCWYYTWKIQSNLRRFERRPCGGCWLTSRRRTFVGKVEVCFIFFR
jgi:hypothetical protein